MVQLNLSRGVITEDGYSTVHGVLKLNQLENAMGKMKQISILINELIADGLLPDPAPVQPTVFVMVCDGAPVGVYVDKQTAEYEMHLCIQGDFEEMGVVSHYELKAMPLVTHRL